MKTVKLAEQFLQYCKENPSLRFWQALSNWTRFAYIEIRRFEKKDPAEDTFYFTNMHVKFGERKTKEE